MEYNERWTRDKYLEYRRLKRNGHSHKMLIEHFGDDIYYSGMYNRTSNIIPYEFFTKYFENKINEIKQLRIEVLLKQIGNLESSDSSTMTDL